MLLGLHSKQLGERGTEVALFDYAHGATYLLGHEVRIFVPADSPRILPEVRHRFEQHFEVVPYELPAEIRCDALYVIKRGRKSSVTRDIPELNHAFHEVDEPHGSRFAAVSDWLAGTSAHRMTLPWGRAIRIPRSRKPQVVPHIVTSPTTQDHLRGELGIPDDAVVFGRHGAVGDFDIRFVHAAVRDALEQRRDLWCVFLNTGRFYEHDRVVHIPRVPSRFDVARFINTCDYMIHARHHGETFGLAVAEFAISGAPVLTYLGSPRLAHLDLLDGDLLLGYRSYDDVFRYMTSLRRREHPVPSNIAVEYGAECVMERFASVFLT